MFRAEVRFYREVAPEVGVRVPACYAAEVTDDGTRLELENLSHWRLGAAPAAAAGMLSDMHRRWQGLAHRRWPWLRSVAAAADLVGNLFDRTWPDVAGRRDLTGGVRALGARLAGDVVSAAGAVAGAGPLTLTHGDVALRNWRTAPDGEIALLDWEDVSAAPGVADLAWLLVSSVNPSEWGGVTDAYGTVDGLVDVLPAVGVQGLLCVASTPEGSPEAEGWISRLDAAADRLA